MKIIFIACLLIMIPISSFTKENDRIDSAKSIMRMTQNHIDNLVLPNLEKGLTKKELKIAKDIITTVVIDENIYNVRAFNNDAIKKVEISTGFLTLMKVISEANILANRFNKTSKLQPYYELIYKYLTGYNINNGENKNLKEPVPFYVFAGIPKKDYFEFIQTKGFDNVITLQLDTIIGFILMHEFGHHILNHLSTRSDDEETREKEKQADEFSLRVNWTMGHNPLVFAPSFLIFAMIEGNPVNGTHPAAASRLEHFLDEGVFFSEKDKDFMNNIEQNPALKSSLDLLKKQQKKLKEMLNKQGDFLITPQSVPGLL